MEPYHKIQSLFKRDPNDGYKTLLVGEYSLLEFEFLAELDWIMTEKVDGMSIRVMWSGIPGDKVRFGGKSDNAQIPVRLYEHLSVTFGPDMFGDNMFPKIFDEGPVCLYGEGFGPGIQKAGVGYGGEQRFILFDVKVGNWWLERQAVEDIAARMNIPAVPVFCVGDLDTLVDIVRNSPMDSAIASCKAEGLVARPAVTLLRRNGERLITKLKVRDFEVAK